MNLDLEKAFAYITKDSSWFNKLIAGSGIILTSYFVLLLPVFVYAFSESIALTILSSIAVVGVFIVFNFALAGYVAETANKRINYNNSILPDWKDFGRMIVTGFKYFIGYFLYFTPLIILSVVFLVLLYCWSISANISEYQDVGFFLAFILFALILLALLIVYSLFCPLMMSSFYKDLKVLSFVDFKNAWTLLKNNVSGYIVLILVFWGFAIVLQTVMTILTVLVVGIIFIPVIYFYFYLVSAELVAQFVLEAKQNLAERN